MSEENHPEDKLKIYKYNSESNEYEYLTDGFAACTIGDIIKIRTPDTDENYLEDKWSDGTQADAVRVESEPEIHEDPNNPEGPGRYGCVIQPIEDPANAQD